MHYLVNPTLVVMLVTMRGIDYKEHRLNELDDVE
jgi:hypothetical protein